MKLPALPELACSLGAEIDPSGSGLIVQPEKLLETARHLKETPGLDFTYLDMITAVDYPDNFEIIYRFLSLKRNEAVIIRTRVDKENASVPSISPLWRGADYQEREIYDLFGIAFAGHPNLRRIMLWEGFKGYPLRKDYQGNA
ncbi:MAG: NADH-quinone oxidoreductase subunit C [Dehalococcoidia bacterium]|nr:NADH-quinone oxidoreductase subunit C [Dehalococcoidia bacterium]